MKKLALLLPLILVGAGCVDTLSDQAVAPIKAPLEAKKVAEDIVARVKTNEAAQLSDAGEGTRLAFILTENSPVPGGAMASQIIGCNDRVAYVQLPGVQPTAYRGEGALKLLLSKKDANVEGLYNPLGQSNLSVEKVVSTDGAVTEVWLTGELKSGGACDDPRIKAQVEETIRLYHPNFKIFLNGSESAWRCFGDQSGICQ